ncbi:MAG: laccase domain-containing protein [Candidatus Rokubacteria bacterium]|nr:laccase domain-containing protein [Candidatus Rokubacteria bacterium]
MADEAHPRTLLSPHGEPPAYFTFPSLTALRLPHATTTRHCPGVASFAEPISPAHPRAPFREDAVATLAAAGLDLSRVAYARQVHGAEAARAPAGGGFAGLVDVITTVERAVPLAVFTADCLAILLYDPGVPALAAAHVGWRGTARGAAQTAVRAVESLGGRASRVHAAISPSIGPCCYEVDEPVMLQFAKAYPGRWEAWATPARPNHIMLDLWGANAALLEEAGMDPARIENPRLCTACHPDLFFSYRKGHRGRLVTLAALP